MIRVVESSVDGVNLKLAKMSWAQAERFHDESKAMLAKIEGGEDIGKQAWFDRATRIVEESFTRAEGEWSIAKIKDSFDMEEGVQFVVKVYLEVLKISGLQVAEPGEVQATAPVSPNSAVA